MEHSASPSACGQATSGQPGKTTVEGSVPQDAFVPDRRPSRSIGAGQVTGEMTKVITPFTKMESHEVTLVQSEGIGVGSGARAGAPGLAGQGALDFVTPSTPGYDDLAVGADDPGQVTAEIVETLALASVRLAKIRGAETGVRDDRCCRAWLGPGEGALCPFRGRVGDGDDDLRQQWRLGCGGCWGV